MKKHSRIEALESRIAPSVFLVTTTADTLDPVHHASGSLRDAIANANNNPGADTIKFKLPARPSHSENIITLNNTYGELLIQPVNAGDSLTITGPGAGKLIIDGGGNSRIFDIDDNSDVTDSPATISGLSLVHGNGNGLHFSGSGGAIFDTESLTIKKCVVSGCTASGVSAYAYKTAGTTVNISNSLITGNTGGPGLALEPSKSVFVTNCQITGNGVTGGKGGGAYIFLTNTGTGATLSHNIITGNTSGEGGGLYVVDHNPDPASKISISASEIAGNTATSEGGGVFVSKGNMIITGSIIKNNTVQQNGGGIEAANGFASLSITGSTISGNQTINGSGTGGGGIFIEGNSSGTPQPVSIKASQISDNTSAATGGGIAAPDGIALTLTSSFISGNTAAKSGGGLYLFGLNKSNTAFALTITGGAFTNNVTGIHGGGIYAGDDGDITITGTKITGNTAALGVGGGGDLNTNGNLVLKGLIVSNNIAADGGGLFLASTQHLTMTGGSITGNAATNEGGGIYGDVITGSILGVTISGNAATDKGGGVFESGGNLTLQVAKVTANTAPTEPNVAGPFTASGPDVAVAAPATSGNLIVTTTDDESDGGTLNDPAGADHVLSLREALAVADLMPGVQTIGFKLPAPAAHDANIILLTLGELTSKGDVTIKGPGAGKLIIDGGGNSRIFDIFDGDKSTDHPSIISGLSLVHGNGTGAHYSGDGGAIVDTESLTVTNCVISGNTASGGVGGIGAYAELNPSTTINISNSFITGNHGTSGAGGVDLEATKSVTLMKSQITGNTGTGSARGGGAYVFLSATGTGATIKQDVITGNTSADIAGGLLLNNNSTVTGSKITIDKTTIAGNTSTSSASGGGGLYARTGETVITHSIIQNNSAKFAGGGIEANGFNSLTISASVVSGNRTTTLSSSYQGGGGIYILGADSGTQQPATITGCTISDNHSARWGGGVLAYGGVDLSITGSTISGNNAAKWGGGLYVAGNGNNRVNLTVTGSTISDNTATYYGGGIHVFTEGNFTISSSKVTGNSAGGHGGGIYARTFGAAVTTIKNNVVATNFSAHGGGGIYLGDTTSFLVTGGSITDNTALTEGGGIDVTSGTGTIKTSIIGNIAVQQGGGVFNDTGNVTLQIAKVIANSAPLGPDVYDTPGDLSTFNLV